MYLRYIFLTICFLYLDRGVNSAKVIRTVAANGQGVDIRGCDTIYGRQEI